MDQQVSMKEDNELMYIYEWVDSVPLSRPKKNIARDFSDGVLMAELVKNHIPKLVEIHNYPAASSTSQKNYNWATLNHKVFKKLGFQISKKDIQDIIACKPMIIENLLKKVYRNLQKYTGETKNEKNEESQLNLSDNEKLNINKSDPYSKDGQQLYSNVNDSQLRKVIEDKDLKIEELRNIIDILEMKLKNSADIQSALEKRVKELNDIIREKGLK